MQAVFFGKLLLNTSVITWIILVLVKNAFISTFQVGDNLMYSYSYYYQYHFYYYIITTLIITSILWMKRMMLKEVSGQATQWGHLRTSKNPELWLHNPFSLLYLDDTLPSCGLPDFFPFCPFSLSSLSLSNLLWAALDVLLGDTQRCNTKALLWRSLQTCGLDKNMPANFLSVSL